MIYSPCGVCACTQLVELEAYRRFKRVTSDCRSWPAGGRLCVCAVCGAVQTPADEVFRREIDEIYRGYEIYDQSEGAEQAVFDNISGAAASRSGRLLERLLLHRPLGRSGRMLDIGCGNGSTLSAFHKLRHQWSLTGTELSDKYRSKVEAIAGAGSLFTCAPADVPGHFELISLVHVLEHVIAPVKFLADLRSKLAPDGLLLVELPSYRANPFELLIADHRSHFDPTSIGSVVQRAGFGIELMSDEWIAKELTVLAKAADENEPLLGNDTSHINQVVDAVKTKLAWLGGVVRMAGELCNTKILGLFGSSIAATWLDAELDQKTAFFVDEDPLRVGRSWRGRPILHHRQVPSGSDLFIPLPGPMAAQVAKRLARPGVQYHFIAG